MEIVEQKKKYTNRIEELANEVLALLYKEEIERADAIATLKIAQVLLERIPCRPGEA